ncbi:MFS transporter [Mycobacterium szulgai]|nr:MFS transporter [Mycobacterium szulgai]
MTGMAMSSRRRNVIFAAIASGMLIAALAVTKAAAVLPTIVADLGGARHQSWIVTAYLLSATAVIPIAGKLGDLLGRKRIFVGALTLFIAASLLSGLSQSMIMLVISRALQGVSGGAIGVTASALAGEIAPPRYRGRYQGILGAVFGIATVTGPLVGGFLSDHLNWRWAFWINVPVTLVILAVAVTAMPKSTRNPAPVIDYLGMALVIVGATGLTMATIWGGTTYAWESAVIIGLFVGSAAVLGVFGWVESRVAAPILPPHLFHDSTFSLCCALAFGIGFSMLGAVTVVPAYLRYVDHDSATKSGLYTLPMIIGMLITSIGSGVLVGRTGRYKIFPVVGYALTAAGYLLLSQMNESTSPLAQSLYLVILGSGIGMSIQLLILIVQNTTSFADLGVATASVTFFRTIGSSFGTAILGALFANFLGQQADSATLHRLPLEVAADTARAYRDSLTQVFFYAALVGLLGFVLALFLREVPLTEVRDARGDHDKNSEADSRKTAA